MVAQRRQPYPILDLTGGLVVDKDPIYIVDRGSPNLRCIRFQKGMIRKDLGAGQFGSGLPLNGPIVFMDTFPLSNGLIKYIFCTLTSIYKLDAGNTYTVVNQSDLTGDEDNRFSGAVTLGLKDGGAIDLYILTNGKDAIQKWEGGSSPFANLSGVSGILAKHLAVFKNRLILLGTTESGTACPRRVRWSIAGDAETWIGTGSGFVELVDTPDWITGSCLLKNRLFIFKERSIWELVYVGGETVFEPQRVVEGVGSFCSTSIIPLGDSIVFFGSDNVYTFDGYTLTPIGSQIYPLLYETDNKLVNSSVVNRSSAVFVEELNEYWLCLPTGGSTVPDTLFKYDFNTRSWTRRDKIVTSFGYYTVPSSARWLDLTGSWANQTWVWGTKILSSGAPTTLLGDCSGYVYEDDRVTTCTDTMIVESKDFMFAHAERIVEFRAQTKGGPFSVYYSLNQGGTWTFLKIFSKTDAFAERRAYLNLTTQSIRFKITTTATELDIKWIEPWYIPRVGSKDLLSP